MIEVGSLLLGSPAKVVRMLSDEEVRHNLQNAENYVKKASETF